MAIDPVASAEIDLLIAGIEVAIGQQHGVAEKGVAQKSAVIATADQESAQSQRKLWPRVAQGETAGMRRAAKRPVALQRRKRPDGNGGKCRVEASKRVRGGW